MQILAFESSCDESALCLFDSDSGFKFHQIASQIALHQSFGGVIPEIATREHLEAFPQLLERLRAAENDFPRKAPDCIAVTYGPGLAGCLAVGMAMAKSLAIYCDRSLVGVNHLHAHAFSPFIATWESCRDFSSLLPSLGLLASGGNTLLYIINEKKRIHLLAETVDDAAGEALDKGAKLLGLPYPGGQEIERQALSGQRDRFHFPRAFSAAEMKFSFSGLKTALRYQLERLDPEEVRTSLADLCASYQEAVVDALDRKINAALGKNDVKSLTLCGGVSQNNTLRERLLETARRHGIPLLVPIPEYGGDNAAMVAFDALVDPELLLSPDGFEPRLPLTL